MIPLDEALRIALSRVACLDVVSVPLDGAVGSVLAEDIASDVDMPPFDKSAMDGFAEPLLWTGIGRARSGCGAALVGTPDQIVEKLDCYRAMGIRSFIFSGYPHLDECVQNPPRRHQASGQSPLRWRVGQTPSPGHV